MPDAEDLLREGARDAGDAEAALAADPVAWRDAAVLAAAGSSWAGGDLAGVRALAEGYDRLLLWLPRLRQGEVVLERVSRAERRHRGAFATPPALAAALALRALPSSGATAALVVDPACGAGALLRAALRRLLALGVPAGAAARCLHGVDADPVAVVLCRTVLAADLAEAGHPCSPEDLGERIAIGDALIDGPAFGWRRAFPDVLDRPDAAAQPVTGWRGGFDAVIANPPWERLKVTGRDWAGAPPEHLRGVRASVARTLREEGRHPLTAVGELNAYLPFVETCWRLLAADGRAALVVPGGFASDRSSAAMLEALVHNGSLRHLHLLDTVEPLFAQVSGQMSVTLVGLHGGPAAAVRAPAAPAEVAVGLAGPDDDVRDRRWQLDAAILRLVNPNTGSVPVFGSAGDARLVTAVHRRHPVLRHRAEGASRDDDGWQLRLVTPLHMTRDAPSFSRTPGPGLLPLWEAKLTGLLDHRGGSASGPRYWVPEPVVRARYGQLCERGWLAGYRNVSTTSSQRTLLPCALPVVAVGNSLPLLSAPRLPLLLAALASLPVDYLLRQRHAGANVNFFKLEQVPLPLPHRYDVPAPWRPQSTIGAWVLARLADAVVWAPELAGLAAELRGLGVAVPRCAPDPARRLLALADLDAVHALLLGLDRAELSHVLDTFTRLRERELGEHGRFVTAGRVLAAYDALTA